MSRKESHVSIMVVMMDLDQEPIYIDSILPCIIDVGAVTNGYHHLRGGRGGGIQLSSESLRIVGRLCACNGSTFCTYHKHKTSASPTHSCSMAQSRYIDPAKSRLAEIPPSGRKPPDNGLTIIGFAIDKHLQPATYPSPWTWWVGLALHALIQEAKFFSEN